jgi:hypothetical protein
VASLLDELREVGASEALTTLAIRAANAGVPGLFVEANPNEDTGYPFGRDIDGNPSEPWKWQQPSISTAGD